MSTQKIEIQKTIKFLNCIEVLAVFGAKVLADGKVNHKDLSSARELMDKIHILLPAFNNISTIAEEIKDIDKAEISILAGRRTKTTQE